MDLLLPKIFLNYLSDRIVLVQHSDIIIGLEFGIFSLVLVIILLLDLIRIKSTFNLFVVNSSCSTSGIQQ